MRRSLILLASVAIIVLGLWGSAVIFLDEKRLNSLVTAHLSAQSGRKVEIHGSLSLRLFPRPHIHAENVVMAPPEGFDAPSLVNADAVGMSLRLLPLIRGKVTPHEVRVSGATVNLYTDEIGRSSVDGLVRSPDSGMRTGAELLATRTMQLEDIRVVINDVGLGQRRSIDIERVEFDRFAFDEPLEFRFRGNLGDPPMFSVMDVTGLLLVPSTRERAVRLSSMHLTGTLAGSELPLELLGHLSMSSVPHFRLELADGQLGVGEQQLALAGIYTGGEPGYLEMVADAQRLALEREAVGAGLLDEQILPLLRGIDSDIQVRVGELELAGTGMQSLRLRLSGRGGFLALDELVGVMPGAVVSGQGGWQLDQAPVEGGVDMELAVDDAGKLLTALGEAPVLEGIGQVQWRWLQSPTPTGAGRLAEGRFELIDGRWNKGRDEWIGFERMVGNFLVSPGVFDVPELDLVTDDGELLGWLSVSLDSDEIGGRLIRTDDGREISLSGDIDQPELSESLVPERGADTEDEESVDSGFSDRPQ